MKYKKAIKVISSCKNCGNLKQTGSDYSCYVLYLMNAEIRPIDDIETIPDDCPLDDA